MERIEVYYRSIIYIGFFIGPKVHPIMKDENNNYYELDQVNGKIKIYTGKINNLGKLTRIFFNKKQTPRETVDVDKAKFLRSVNEFKKINEGKFYNLLNFSTNCIGFKNFVFKNSKKEKI